MKNTKVLFIGGIKSGKSANAESYILSISKEKPTYIATTEFIDEEMKEKINKHKKQREDKFITKEEALELYNAASTSNNTILIECISMWINNMLYHKKTFQDMQKELTKILTLDKTIVFVLNDVSRSVVSQNKLTRDFVNINGILSQQIAAACDEVYNNTAGLMVKIK